jgi:hypothetical protein
MPLSDLECKRAKKENRYGFFSIEDEMVDRYVKEVNKALDLVCVDRRVHYGDHAKTTYWGYSPKFLPLTKGQPPIEYSALLDGATKRFIKFAVKRDLVQI